MIEYLKFAFVGMVIITAGCLAAVGLGLLFIWIFLGGGYLPILIVAAVAFAISLLVAPIWDRLISRSPKVGDPSLQSSYANKDVLHD